jgi:phytoene dehydrogenase-like protein
MKWTKGVFDSKTRLFNRYATYNGSNPFKAPGILNIIPHLEFGLGAYLPKEGCMRLRIVCKLAKEIGVEFQSRSYSHWNRKNLVKSVTTISDNYAADVIVCNADIHTVYDKLIPSAKN